MFEAIKKVLKKYFGNLAFFLSYLRWQFFGLLGISLVSGLIDGVSLALFVPILQATDSTGELSGENLGSLDMVIDFLKSTGMTVNLNSVIILMLAIFAVKGFVKYYEFYYRAKLRLIFISKLRYQMIGGMANMKYSHFVNSDAGKIQNILSGEVQRVANGFMQYLTSSQSFVMLVLYIILAFMANPQFAFLVLLGGLLTNFIYRMMYKRTKALSSKISGHGHMYQGFLIQSVQYFKYLKATAGIQPYKKKLLSKVDDMEDAQLRIGKLSALMVGIRESLAVGIVLSVVLIQVNFFGSNFTSLILSLMFFYRSLAMVMILQNSWNNYLANEGALIASKEFLNELSVSKERRGKVNFDDESANLKLSGVSFSYEESKPTLKNINLEISPNETIAFVGESGSGKTTLVNLIAGLFDKYSGQISVNDVPFKELNIHSWQSKIGYITQEAVVFNDTIENNITFWEAESQEVTSKLNEAMKKAAIGDFVKSLPSKEGTILGNNGINLSGGQKQRISIARELYKNIQLLIMDEATSALDSETELMIQENVDLLKGQYTIIIIAHRLSTVKNADRIVVMNNGEIESVGTFEELMLSSKRFKRMVSLQEF